MNTSKSKSKSKSKPNTKRGGKTQPKRDEAKLGIPLKLLHEASGHVVTVELKSGEVYRGSMLECEDNWNFQMEDIIYTAKDGKVSQLEHVFIRGSKVRFMVIPDMLKNYPALTNAPMFKRLDAKKGKSESTGAGRGRAQSAGS